MGIVRFSCPTELVQALVAAGQIDAAIETGTYKAEGTLALRKLVSRVWTVELSDGFYERAIALHGHLSGVTFIRGSSDTTLVRLAGVVEEPLIFWLDAHGGMVDMATGHVVEPTASGPQCPLLAELEAVRLFRYSAASCVLIDDARTFLGPLPQHRVREWPSLLQIIDLLRKDCDRYITVLDDVIIAVPPELRDVVDRWWLNQSRDRRGRDGYQQKLWDAYNPSPFIALRRLIKSLTPGMIRKWHDARR